MAEKNHYSEEDLETLIKEKISSCQGLPQVCQMISNEVGRKRIAQRVKEILFMDGITNIDAALAQIESQLNFEVD